MKSPDVGTIPRSLACLGDSADIRAWSGIPYYLFHAGRDAGFFTNSLDLMDPRYRQRRMAWALGNLARFRRAGGYQYSPESVRRMWERVPEALRHGEFISHFQLFPPPAEALAAGAQFSSYIDTTLRQLFESQEASDRLLNARQRARAIEQETAVYQSCRFVLAMARRTAEAVIRDYNVDARKVFVVRPGANLDETAVKEFLRRRGPSWRTTKPVFTSDHPARLGFIGRDWERKGLPRLVAAAEILRKRGRPVVVTVVGADPPKFRGNGAVELLGLISKSTELDRFLQVIESFALGCLPSHFEPLGISTLECLRLGVPAMGTDVGGIPDCIPEGAGFVLPANVDGPQIADAIERHLFDADAYARICQGAVQQSEHVTWHRTVENLIAIWEGRVTPPFAKLTSQRQD